MKSTTTFVNGKSNFSVDALENGVYIINLALENGKTSQIRFVKK